MSQMPSRRLSSEIPVAHESPSTGSQGGRILSLCHETAPAFDSMETNFFKEGDELSGAAGGDPQVAPVARDPWDEPTLVCARRRRGRLGSWAALAATGFAVTAAIACWHVRRSAAAASPPPPVPPALPVYVPPPPPIPAPAAPQPDDWEASPPRAAAGTLPSETDDTALAACKTAYGKHRGKRVLSLCARAFAAHPASAEVAVMLARTEFDRGHFRPALDWAKQAIVLDESQADAYVFLGGAEQAAGHAAAAKAAYKRYLQLSPKGRYAADLRTIMGGRL